MHPSKATKFRIYEASMCQKALPPLTVELLHIIFTARLWCSAGGFADTVAFCVEELQKTYCKNDHEGSDYLKTGEGELAFIPISASGDQEWQRFQQFFFLIVSYVENTTFSNEHQLHKAELQILQCVSFLLGLQPKRNSSRPPYTFYSSKIVYGFQMAIFVRHYQLTSTWGKTFLHHLIRCGKNNRKAAIVWMFCVIILWDTKHFFSQL